jgi:hypothetical protein
MAVVVTVEEDMAEEDMVVVTVDGDMEAVDGEEEDGVVTEGMVEDITHMDIGTPISMIIISTIPNVQRIV